jgi:hypothetical protein
MPNECTHQKNELRKPCRKFTIAEANTIVNHIWDHCCIDTQDRFHNTFFHEICPLLLIAEHIGGEATRIVFSGTKLRFDGLLLLENGRRQKVELTAAIDGQNEALRMELLAERGHAPAFQKIEASGTKRNRTFGQNETDGGRTDEYDHEMLLPRLERALAIKCDKARTNQHYSGAWLGVVFDDWVCPLGRTKKKKRFDPFCRRLLGDSHDRYAPFSRVFIIGVSRKYLFDSCVT